MTDSASTDPGSTSGPAGTPAVRLLPPRLSSQSFRFELPAQRHTFSFSMTHSNLADLGIDVVSLAPWLEVVQIQRQITRVGVTVCLHLDQLPCEAPQEGRLEVRWVQGVLPLAVYATRFDIHRALARYQAGRLDETRQLCRQLLEASPQQRDALYLLCTLELQTADLPVAEQLLQTLSHQRRERPLAPELAGVPTEVLTKLLEQLQEHPALLQESEWGLEILEDLHEHTLASSPPYLLDMLREAYKRLLRDLLRGGSHETYDAEASTPRPLSLRSSWPLFEPEKDAFDALERTERSKVRQLVGRASTLFPDDPQFRLLSDRLFASSQRRRLGLALGVVRVVVLVLAILLGAWEVYTRRQEAGLRAARDAMQAHNFEQALETVGRILPLGQASIQAHQLTGEIWLAWSEHARSKEDYAVAYARVQTAAQLLPASPAPAQGRLQILRDWTQALVHQGRYDLALERCRQALEQAPSDVKLLALHDSLLHTGGFYAFLRSLATHTFAKTEIAEPACTSTLAHGLGIKLGAPGTQVLIDDLDGDGIDELCLAGQASGAPSGQTRVVLCAPVAAPRSDGGFTTRLKVLYAQSLGERKAPECLREHVAVALGWQERDAARRAKLPAPLLGGPRLIQIDESLRSREARGQSTLVWWYQGQVHRWSPPKSNKSLEVRTVAGSPALAAWVWQAQSKQPASSPEVSVPVPYRFQGQVLQACPELYADYYLDEVLPQLERTRQQTLAANPKHRARLEREFAQALKLVRDFSRR